MNYPLVLRIPSPLANMTRRKLIREGRRFAVEVVGDPYDQMSPGAMRHPLRPYFRWRFTAAQHSLVRSARVVKYVTRSALQRRYPAPKGAAVHAISDVFLPPEAFRFNPRPYDPVLRVVFVGMVEQLYKGPDTLLEAVAIALSRGVRLTLTMIGDGRYRPMLEHMAEKLNVGQAVTFRGGCSTAGIREVLDGSDLFVLPSRQEGLPRAMLEAMARGLPCIGTPAGGIPELIEPEFLVQPNDTGELAAKLAGLAANRERLSAAGERNFRVAQEYALPVRFQHESLFAHDVRKLCC